MKVRALLNKVEELLLKKGETERETINLLKAIRMDHPALNLLQSSDEVEEAVASDILEQFANDVPVQYITSMSHFFGLRFYVNPSVLIPRPETEELIYNVIQYVQCTEFNILDIGTGSGCIPITLKTKCDQSAVTAIDVSKEALEVARKNALHHNVAIDFKQIDFLDKSQWEGLEKYDVIISNPPYISLSEKPLMGVSTLKHEPEIALFTESDPLIFYKNIKWFAENHLNDNGAIFMELNEFNAQKTLAIFEDDYECELIEDMQGKTRILKCNKK